MILTRKFQVAVDDSEKYGFEKDVYYHVIGSKSKTYQKDGHEKKEWLFLVVNKDDRPFEVFTTKCRVRIEHD